MGRIVKIIDVTTALEAFEIACVNHAAATETGDFKTGNKNYDIIIKSVNYLKEQKAINDLKDFLNNSNIGVRLWSASYWLSINEEEGIKVLEEIIRKGGIHAFDAEMTLSEWKKGNLEF